MPGDSEACFDFKVSEIRESINQASAAYSPSEVRDIVATLFIGKNYRRLTEKPTRQAISVFVGWILNLSHRACIMFGDEWKEKLLASIPKRKITQEEKWLRLWLLGLTHKTAQNLGVKVAMHEEYQKMVKDATDEVVEQFGWEPSVIEISSEELERVTLSRSDSIWLLQIAGAAVLTIRGSKKAITGKRLEKAIARAALKVLGLTEGENFWLNVGRDQEVDREIDAEITTRRAKIRVDIALIGTGNQEVSEDKLGRVGRNGIVLVDILGPKSQVPRNAARHDIRVIQLRNNFALSELHAYLEPLMPDGVQLDKPPATEESIVKIVSELPDDVFTIPTR